MKKLQLRIVSPLTNGNVTFSVLEFSSLVMFAATGYNKSKQIFQLLQPSCGTRTISTDLKVTI